MFVGSFIIQYFLMSYVATDSLKNIKNSLGKMNMSIIMGFSMVLLQLLMHGGRMIGSDILVLFTFLTILSIVLYRNRVLVGDSDFLNEMIEHHSMALLTSRDILKKTKNKEITELANNIINTQEKEIDKMNQILNN
jgi:hypothetical protein